MANISNIIKTTGYFVTTIGYGITRNIYYIPKIKEIENTYKEPYVYKDRLIGDKILNSIIGVVCTVSPLFVWVALYDDINRVNAYFNKSLYKQHKDYFESNVFPYSAFSKRCIDKNIMNQDEIEIENKNESMKKND